MTVQAGSAGPVVPHDGVEAEDPIGRAEAQPSGRRVAAKPVVREHGVPDVIAHALGDVREFEASETSGLA